MTHLELENLASDYLEGQLAAARRGEVETHLQGCAACRELVADLRHALELCRSARELEPAPWLISRIMRATVGERKPTLRERWQGFFQPVLQPRLAYAVAMAVFSVSMIVTTAGINLQNLTLQDLSPRTWFYQANRTGHLLYARAEKFYYDLRVVYEIESRLRQLRQQNGSPAPPPERESAPPEGAPGKSTDGASPARLQLADAGNTWQLGLDGLGKFSQRVETQRSSSR
jgi:Putative zinc-finger